MSAGAQAEIMNRISKSWDGCCGNCMPFPVLQPSMPARLPATKRTGGFCAAPCAALLTQLPPHLSKPALTEKRFVQEGT